MMATDLQKIKENWREHEHFSKYVSTYDELNLTEQQQQQQKLTEFLRYACESLKKHFKQWTSNNFFLGLFSNHHTARQVANFILGRNGVNMVTYKDDSHNASVNCSIFFDFLKQNVSKETILNVRNLPVVINNRTAIYIIAAGGNIWHSDATTSLLAFRNLYLHQYSAFPTNTQFVERGVKESGYVSLGRRGEAQRSVLAIS